MAVVVDRLHLIDEIKNLRRELDRREERLRMLDRPGGRVSTIARTPEEWIAWADDLTARISAKSTGGDAVEDVRQMRERA